jgi:hypothetical protein
MLKKVSIIEHISENAEMKWYVLLSNTVINNYIRKYRWRYNFFQKYSIELIYKIVEVFDLYEWNELFLIITYFNCDSMQFVILKKNRHFIQNYV